MKSWFLVPLLSALLLVPVRADDLNARAATVKPLLQTQWLPIWAKKSTANESATDAAQVLRVLSRAHRLGYSTPDLILLEAARAHYKLLRDSRRDKTNEGFVEQGANAGAASKSTQLQANVILALVEFARISGENEQRPLAIKTWRLLRDRARDRVDGGYFDSLVSAPATPTSATAFGHKTASTHLALLEAGTALYELTHDRSIRTDLLELLDLNAGRFFPARIDEAATIYSSNWEKASPVVSPPTALWDEAGVAIARAQIALGMSVNWVDFVHRTDDPKPTGSKEETAPSLAALTLLAPISSNREPRAAQIDALLDKQTSDSSPSSLSSGLALLEFVDTFGK